MRFGVRQGNRHVKCRFHRFAFRSAPSSPYDVENRLLTSAPIATPSTPNLKLVYDPEGRLARYSIDNGVTWTQFAYDGTNLIAEYNNAGTLQRRYIFGPGTDELVGWIETGRGSANVHHMFANYQGSIIATADLSGNLEASYQYGPYGEPEINKSPSGAWTSGPRFRYTGQIMLGNAQLYYYKARVYDPIYGHFLQTDPVGSDDDLDLYSYTGDDPVNGSDPTGKVTVDCVGQTVTGWFATYIEYTCTTVDDKSPDTTLNLTLDGESVGSYHIAGDYRNDSGAYDQTSGLINDTYHPQFTNNRERPRTRDDQNRDNQNANNGNEATPKTDRSQFENWKDGSLRNKDTGEIWKKDQLHKDHYEVYKNDKDFEAGRRSRDVWDDGRPKRTF